MIVLVNNIMTEPLKQVIKRAISHRQNSIKEALLPDRSLRRTSFEMSSQLSPARQRPVAHLNRKQRAEGKKRRKNSRISMHPFSYYSHKLEQPEEFKSNEQAHAFIYHHYDIMDLSYSLISSDISKFTLLLVYIILIAIRYGSLLCLVYITFITHSKYWEWILCIVITYTIYFVSMVKVSLRPAENKCETILKLTFDSLQEHEAVEHFQIIQTKKLMQSVIRALVPPEFSFIYIIGSSQMKRVDIYCMVNYIYSSIEAIIYYPFFVIYTSFYFASTMEEIPEAAYLTVMGAIMLAESIFIILTAYLIWYGCKKRGFGRSNN